MITSGQCCYWATGANLQRSNIQLCQFGDHKGFSKSSKPTHSTWVLHWSIHASSLFVSSSLLAEFNLQSLFSIESSYLSICWGTLPLQFINKIRQNQKDKGFRAQTLCNAILFNCTATDREWAGVKVCEDVHPCLCSLCKWGFGTCKGTHVPPHR
jgi:hypothetical protein